MIHSGRESEHTYDSLAEAYLLRGDKALAKANYEKAYALNPKNTHAAEVVKQLGTEQ